MTLTTEQLDAIATKLMGWKRGNTIVGISCRRFNTNGTIGGLRARLDPTSPADAMLVLDAMGRWCDNDPRLLRVSLESCGKEWICEIIQRSTQPNIPHLEDDPDDTLESELGDSIPAAIFACAAKLVERMSDGKVE